MKKCFCLTISCILCFFSFSQTWTSFGQGIPNGLDNEPTVFSIIEYNGILYAGGNIATAGGTTINGGLAKWDGYAWSDGGLSATVQQMLVFNNELYAVGSFGIRKWQDTAWMNLGTGLNAGCNAMCVYDNQIYVGGYFDTAGGVAAYSLAMWDGSQWSAVGGGTDGSVSALAVYNNMLYVIGSFTQINGVTTANSGAIWDGANLNPMPGTNLIAPSAPAVVYNDTLYFSNISSGNVYRYASDSASIFIPFGQISGNAFCFIDLFGKLYMGFKSTCGSGYGALSFYYDGSSLNPFTIGTMACNGAGYCFGEYDCQLVASGMNAANGYDFERLWDAPHAGFTAEQITVCQGDSVTFTDTVCQGATSLLWNFPGGSPASSTLENPHVAYPQAGTYAVSLTVTNPVGSDTAKLSNYITVTPSPSLPTITKVGNILVSSASSGNQWYRNDTLIGNDTTRLDTLSANIGFYQCYSVTVSNGTACMATSDTVCFSPVTMVGIQNIGSTNLNIYPNPAKSEVHVEYELTGTYETQLSLLNILGEVVYRSEPMQESGAVSKTINTNVLAPGVYLLQLKVNGEIMSRKICVE